MGTLKPGATYIYERAGGVTYAREFGSTIRTPIGWDHTAKYVDELRLWQDIRETAKTNPSLQKALDNVIIVYKLSKDNPL
jgi:hypothetical protein